MEVGEGMGLGKGGMERQLGRDIIFFLLFHTRPRILDFILKVMGNQGFKYRNDMIRLST